ncbi:helicase-related protein [Hyphomicrobium sp.]|uniref:helicase-related protein n=1 Tax=Hyphomicrobium sp. TaxID=82 RepID=UPI002C97828B|nr:helicase-related protein [Hyphomicrobium sp.]HRN87831.1 helicase-related protein [Hyphomicrobium sp.]HRQ26638.1 helicase-related protein [Hyphomicrobium sp.]
MVSDLETRIRNVTAVLGPTNTGKTHLAIERMLGHETGMIGLPLRLLAREVYDKIAARIGADKVALVTGEEKIKPERARYWVSTVEAMPRDVDVDFLAIDEIQLAADPERGHVFTDRLLHARGRQETLLLGAQTMRDAIADLIPGANFISRPRLSRLTYAGEKKITRLPGRTAVVAFSANEVYAIAELIRRQRGGTAVVLGALSPRTRNAQVELYQSGDVDFLVATDAIGMGLNLDVDHVAFSAVRKFDGHTFRNLTPGEIGQIAGRAGRHMNDGTFGVTGNCEPFDSDLVERLETHTFDNVRVLQWRNRNLDFGSLDRLRDSLREIPNTPRLARARMADDVIALETLANDREIARLASGTAAVSRLWEVCQIPDYRKISSQNHAELVGTLYSHLMGSEGRVPEDWFAKQVAFADRTDGDIDTLANRIAHIRTWTFVSNRADWLRDPQHWQGRTREIEDALSDALHTCLTQRFVDSRTSALMKGLRDKEELTADIGEDGAIRVENHYVGRLTGFRFSPETQADGIHGRATRNAAAQVLSRELAMRARRVAAAKSDAFRLTRGGRVLWRDEEIAKFEAADDPLKPLVAIIADEHLSAPDREKVQTRLEAWRDEIIAERLKPLVDIAKAEDVAGLARGIAFRLTEGFGMLKRELVADMMKHLDQQARAELRRYGVRFGAFNIFFPSLLKPAPAELAATLWALKHGPAQGLSLDALPEMPRAGLTSAAAQPDVPEALYRAHGFHVCGPRAVRIDILERLADLIRPLLAWRANPDNPTTPPKGATGDGGFVVTPEMMSILGCSPEELSNVLKVLGFRLDRKTMPRPVEAPKADTAAASEPAPEAATADAADETVRVEQPAQDADVVATVADTEPAAESTGSEAAVAAEAAGETLPPAAAEASSLPTGEPDTVVIEIWRPRRHRHGEGHRQGEGRGEERQGRRDGRPHRGRRGPQRGEGHAQVTGSATPGSASAAPAAANGEAAAEAPRGPRERGRDRPSQRGQGDQSERGRPRGPRPRDGGPGGDRRRDERRRHEDRQGPAIRSASPPKKGGVDPDSPFASLGALRDELAKQAREKNSS